MHEAAQDCCGLIDVDPVGPREESGEVIGTVGVRRLRVHQRILTATLEDIVAVVAVQAHADALQARLAAIHAAIPIVVMPDEVADGSALGVLRGRLDVGPGALGIARDVLPGDPPGAQRGGHGTVACRQVRAQFDGPRTAHQSGQVGAGGDTCGQHCVAVVEDVHRQRRARWGGAAVGDGAPVVEGRGVLGRGEHASRGGVTRCASGQTVVDAVHIAGHPARRERGPGGVGAVAPTAVEAAPPGYCRRGGVGQHVEGLAHHGRAPAGGDRVVAPRHQGHRDAAGTEEPRSYPGCHRIAVDARVGTVEHRGFVDGELDVGGRRHDEVGLNQRQHGAGRTLIHAELGARRRDVIGVGRAAHGVGRRRR